MISARHVFHSPRSGWDRVHAWREATGEPAFVWGTHSGAEDARLFGPVKRAFAQWTEATGADAALTVYHDGFGADALGPLDPSAHKVLCLHHWYPNWQRQFEWQLRCTGKVLVGDSGLARLLHGQFAWIPERFIGSVPQPRLSSAEELTAQPGRVRRRTGIWLQGVHWRPYGNRLRAILDRWPADAGEVEVITEGGGPPRWARKPFIIWNSGMPFEFALHRLLTWDSTLLLNDYALDAPWLLRALALGCFPLVPAGDSPARNSCWTDDSAPQPYPWGDTLQAVALLQDWRAQRDALFPEFQKWAQSVVGQHPESTAFPDVWNAQKQAFLAQRVPRLRRRRPVASLCPVAWYERLQRLRAGF